MSRAATLIGQVTNHENQPDLRGNMGPVSDEIFEPNCVVTGTIPERLRGSFIRNGPNPLFEPIGRYHVFDGDGMLHGIHITDAGVSYQNRWVRSRGLEAELRLGHGLYPSLGEVMDFPPVELTGDAGPVKNPANTHVIEHAGRMLALWEGGLPTEVTRTLDTVGEYTFAGKLKGPMTAHPRLDPHTGEMLFFGYSLFPPYLRYYVVNAEGELVHKLAIDLPAPVMMHDFIITKDYSVFLDSPIVFNIEMLGKGPMVQWKPENGTRVGVMPRMGTAEDLKWFEIESGHVQHFWNGWQDGNRIEFSGSRFAAPNFGIDPSTPLDQSAASTEAGCPTRYWIDLDAGTAGCEQFDDLSGDFNRINDAYNGVPSRCLYMSAFMSAGRPIGDFDTIVKYDEQTGARSEWFSGPSGHVGETVFAADPLGTAEDDGWLLNVVYDDQSDSSDLVILDARDIGSGPVARVRMPRRVPFGFHANWFADPLGSGAVSA